jgi:hypothetical protein
LHTCEERVVARLLTGRLTYPQLEDSDEYLILGYIFCRLKRNSLDHVVAR